MSDSSHRSPQAIRYPTELELAAYNEAGHAVVGVIQGRYIEYVMLKQEGERWGGETKYVILRDPDCWHAVENLVRAIVKEYTEGSAMRGERAHEIINQAFTQKQDLGL